MGLGVSTVREVFGGVSHYESYAFNVVSKYDGWEVRRYAGAVAAQISQSPENKQFMQLARYIGVFSTPENTKGGDAPEAVAMTTPVVSSVPEPVAMTTPVVSTSAGSHQGTMQFVLPSKYTCVEDAPKPTNPAVQVVALPSRDMAVIQFNGYCDDNMARGKYGDLVSMMAGVGLEATGPWELHRFNPPYTPGPFRTNEVCVPVQLPPPNASSKM